MDIAVLPCAASKSARGVLYSKNEAKSDDAGFEEILRGFGKRFKKDSSACGQDLYSILLQYPTLISLFQCSDDQAGNESLYAICGYINTQTQVDALLSDDEKIARLWQTLVSSFTSEGKFDGVAAARFYEALKSSLPEISEVDFELFLEQLKNKFNQAFNNLIIAKDEEVTENKNQESIETGSLEENAMQKDFNFRNSLAKSENSAFNNGENYRKDMVMAKGQETSDNHPDSNRESQTAKLTNSEFETRDMKKESDNALKNDYSGFDGFLSEASADSGVGASKSVISDRIQKLSDERSLAVEALDKIVDKIQMALKDKTSELSLKLKPDYLGNVLIKIISEGEKIRAEIFVENAYVHEAMQYHAQELKNQIQQHGYNLTELNVYQTSDWFAGNFSEGGFRQQNTGYYHFKRAKFNYHYQEKQIEEIMAKSQYDDWQKTGNINYVV
ncbi:MAG: flagellar hook-length control protein FliK [Tepidanaerobacteraceae bacterium]|nr:flagellar hook-length control protein FliK [Tepidanaerobacteraceae bacterium]